MLCKYCNTTIEEGSKFCANCGAPASDTFTQSIMGVVFIIINIIYFTRRRLLFVK